MCHQGLETLQGWIPKGYVTLVAGETGAAKSTLLADITARVTTGRPWPGETEDRLPGSVIWLGSEDAAEDVLVPRLMACGAKLDHVIELQGVSQGGTRSTFSMQDDIADVKAWLEKAREMNTPFSMLIIDPITSYLPGQRLRKVDLSDAGQLRSILEPWLAVAQQFNLAIVCVTHFGKDTTRSMLHRVLGSAAFAQTCRSLCAVVSRTDEGLYAKSLIQVKVNLPEHPGGGWLFTTEKVEVGTDKRNGKSIYATRPVWEQLDAAVTPENIIGGTRGPVSEYPGPFVLWLRTYFTGVDHEQGLPAGDVKAAAVSAKIVSARWWDDHSSEYLEKKNVGGTWMCRPKTT